ncbi:MAG: alpha/beta fold hydrolase [Myxococcales bacterium]|nr:alpha/beta fold hydrolase [Myxococcales bacterium]
MRRLLIGDRKVRIRDEGDSARKAPVVLIHGAGGSSVAWMDVVKRLAPRRRVIAPDLPGHGQSDPWHGVSSVTMDLYRDFVGTLCAHLGMKRVVLVGHSMGGAIALRCALAWPDRVAGLVLVCSAARIRVAPALTDPKTDVAALLREVAWSPSTPREVVERWSAVMIQAEPEVVAADFRALEGFDVRPELPSLRVPSLAIGGSDDLILPPKLTRELAAALPNARAVILPHTGHMAMNEQPDAFHAALDPFLAELA